MSSLESYLKHLSQLFWGAASLSLHFYPQFRPGEDQCWRHVNFAFPGESSKIFQDLQSGSIPQLPSASHMPSLVPVPERIELSPAPSKPRRNTKLQNVAETSVNICGLGPTWLQNTLAITIQTIPNLWRLPEEQSRKVRNCQFDSCNHGEQGQAPRTAKVQEASDRTWQKTISAIKKKTKFMKC